MRPLSPIRVLVAILVSAGSFLLLSPTSAHAVSGSDWKPGRIIDDVVFQNKSSMTVQQIQQFLDSKVPVCDTAGSLPMWSGGPSRAQWAIDNGKDQAPYTCLKNYVENPATKQNNAADPTTVVPGGLSAAQLIYNAAQTQNINPQVYLVLLQKEQSLVTDDWPFITQFEKATGNNCPDTAPCNPAFAWLWTQVNNSGAQFNYYVTHFDEYNYAPGWNNILYNPNSGCGTQSVFIENRFTAALYIYTPYVPNQAALNNMYGTGDSCSAYGNRNFWRMFNDWFGSSLNPAYSTRVRNQSPYPAVKAGSTTTVFIDYENTGNIAWRDSVSTWGIPPVELATADPINRASPFWANWSAYQRPTKTFNKVFLTDGVTLAQDQHSVLPGQIARFEFILTIPVDMKPGVYRESYYPVIEGEKNWYMGGLSWFDITIQPTTYSVTYVSQSAFPSLKAGESTVLNLRLKNSGTATWRDDVSAVGGISPVHMATIGPINRQSVFGASWWSPSRQNLTFSRVFESDGTTLSSDQHLVLPNQVVEYDYGVTVPVDTLPGTYREMFSPILESASNWNMNFVAWTDITVLPTTFTPVVQSQSSFPTVQKGQSTSIFFQLKNSGAGTWRDDLSPLPGVAPMHLATYNPINRNSDFNSASWWSKSRPALTFNKVFEPDGTTLSPNQHIVIPGQMARFEFSLTVPATTLPGTYRETFTPIFEGAKNWNQGVVMWQDIQVTD